MQAANLTTTSYLSLPTKSYIYRIVPVGSWLAAISSDDSLRIIDPSTLQELSDGVVNNVHTGVTCLESIGNDHNSILTAGRDAVIRCWDLRSRKKTAEFSDDSKAAYLALCQGNSSFAAGTEFTNHQATVLLWESRNPSKPIRQYVESHNDDVTEVKFHPTSHSTLLSGSTDGLVNIYNTSHSDEDDALIQVINHNSSINHANFLSDSQFFALSHDETFSTYQLESPTNPTKILPPNIFGDLRPLFDCEYIVDVLPANANGGAILGAGSHSEQHLDLIPLRYSDIWSFDPSHTIRLPGAHGEEIVRSMYIDHASKTVFTAGEDGLIKAWRTSSESNEDEMQDAEIEKPRQQKRKEKSKGEGEKGRFRPY